METIIAFPAMVKQFRTANNLTMEQLAEQIGKTKSTISKWESGTRSPKIYEIEELAHFFGISPQMMMFGEDTPDTPTLQAITDKVVQLELPRQEVVLECATDQLDQQEKAKKAATVIDLAEKRAQYEARRKVPKHVPGKVAAGTGYWQEEDDDTFVDFYEDSIPDEDDYDTIAFVVGHSMAPTIKNGDFLFIKLTPSVDVNQIGIFQINGENVVKKRRHDRLESLNPDYDDIYPTEDDDVRAIGQVVEVYRG